MEAAAVYTNGINGTSTPHLVNGAAGPSKPPYATPPLPTPTPNGVTLSTSTSSNGMNGALYPPPPSHNDRIVDHLWTAGFQHGNYADTQLHIFSRTYRLHAIILSRSPFLAHLINTSESSSIRVPVEQEPLINEEGFAVALGYLYSSYSATLVKQHNALSVLASACLLGGMDDLAGIALEKARQTISLDSLPSWTAFLEKATPESVLGPYAQRLKNDVFAFLVSALPNSLGAFPTYSHPERTLESGETGYQALLRVYSTLPFEVFKHAVESPMFPVPPGNEQARFNFAKEAITLRKNNKAGHGAEESVVLAFGKAEGGSAVHITRKMKKRPLWKVPKAT